MSLFRNEVVERQHRFYGDILITIPPSINILILIAFFTGLSVSIFCAFGEYTKKETIQGVLLPEGGIIKVFPRQSGVITRLMVKEGDTVKAGQPLYVISTETNSQTDGGLRERVGKLLEENAQSVMRQITVNETLNDQKKQDLNLEIEQLTNKYNKTNQLLEIKEQQLAIWKQTDEAFSIANQRHLISKIEFNEQRSKFLSLKSEVKSIILQLDELAYQIKLKKFAVSSSDNQLVLQKEQLKTRVSDVNQQLLSNNALQEFVVQSPIDATVSAIQVYQGVVSQDAVLLNLEPQGKELQATLYVPSRAIGFLEKGQEIFLQYDAFPYQKFGQYRGVISDISGVAVPSDNIQSLAGIGDMRNKPSSVYVVKIDLDTQFVKVYGKPKSLRSGMNFDASIRVDKRKIYEWLLDPFKKMQDYI